jgi:hypothetical protein
LGWDWVMILVITLIIWLLTLDIEQPPPTLVVENISLERIESHKVLGLTIQNNLKWDLHISEIVTKASKDYTSYEFSSAVEFHRFICYEYILHLLDPCSSTAVRYGIHL